MKGQEKSVTVRREQANKLEIRTDGRNHKIMATEDIAKGFTVAASVITGFLIGFFSMNRS
jgi:hypothetical protein